MFERGEGLVRDRMGAVNNLRQYRDDGNKPSQASACHFSSIAPARRAVEGRMSASAT